MSLDGRITNSQMQALKDCPRKAQLAYQLGIRTLKDAKPLRIGSAFHLAQDLFAQSKLGQIDLNEDAIVRGVLDKYEEFAPDGGAAQEEIQDFYIEKEILARMLAGYRWRWSEVDKGVHFIATERNFSIPLVNPETGRASRTFTLDGKIDKILGLGKIQIIREHKTTTGEIEPDKEAGHKYWLRLRIDSQISTYMIAAKVEGYDPRDVEYDVVRVPKVEPIMLTQRDTKVLVETGEYQNKFRGDESFTSINMNMAGWPMMSDVQMKEWREERVFVVDGDTTDGQFIVTVDGEQVEAKKGAKYDQNGSFAIRESTEMFGQRILADMGRRPNHYFQRKTIPRTPEDLEEHMYGTWAMAEYFRRCKDNDLWPRNDRHCLAYGQCQYFPLCTGGFSPRKFKAGEQELPEGFRIVEDVHQELLEDAGIE